MLVKSILLKNYKNLSLELDFAPGINLLVAPNGTGKTNLLEAINYVADGNSFRGISDEFIEPDNNSQQITSLVSLQVESDSGQVSELKISWQFPQQKKTYLFNTKKTNLQKFKRNFHTLVHAPASLDVVSGPASNRRNFLDRSLMLLRPQLKHVFSDYRKALLQKNRLLRGLQAGKVSRETCLKQLPFWNEKLILLGNKITQERLALLETILPLMQEIAESVYHLGSYEVEYEHHTRGELAELLKENQEKELVVGRSLYGSHKDDYEFMLNSRDVRNASSRGQQRLYSLILHLAVARLIDSEKEELGVLLLDDIFSELDPEHREKTLAYLKAGVGSGLLGQVFITSPDNRDISSNKGLKLINLSSSLEAA